MTIESTGERRLSQALHCKGCDRQVNLVQRLVSGQFFLSNNLAGARGAQQLLSKYDLVQCCKLMKREPY